MNQQELAFIIKDQQGSFVQSVWHRRPYIIHAMQFLPGGLFEDTKWEDCRRLVCSRSDQRCRCWFVSLVSSLVAKGWLRPQRSVLWLGFKKNKRKHILCEQLVQPLD